MGPKKKWTGHYQAKRPREGEQDGNGGSGDGGPKKPRRAAAISLGNVKGHQAVVGTCDVRHDRQATAELVDMLNSVADDMYPETDGDDAAAEDAATASPVAPTPSAEGKPGNGDSDGAGASASSAAAPAGGAAEMSVEEMVKQEADALRSGSDKVHRFKSVNTSVKGVVMVCVMDPKVDILRLVDALYDEIRTTKMRRSRFLERVTPLQVTAYSELDAIKEAVGPIVSKALPPVAEGVPPLPTAVRASGAKAAGPAAVKTEKRTPAPKDSSGDKVKAAETEEKEGEGAAASAPNGTGDKAGGGAGSAAPGAAGTKEGDVVSDGKEKETCDKRWKFRADIRRRNSGLKRLDLINAAVGSVGVGHSVNMTSPEVTIVVEAVKSVVGVSVLFNYAGNHEYSISRLQDAVCGAILDS
ncbi:unnamed protein product [Ectocarpus sp. 6 AP-2014]